MHDNVAALRTIGDDKSDSIRVQAVFFWFRRYRGELELGKSSKYRKRKKIT